ncbi:MULTISPECIES: tetratricopeptide repeat protein [unclassified Moorena]|uniref:tetratricopeptide repeat protein n=1 Tax=unclassified Moorena TaxID=2683338 RepID=UPI0013FE9F65|nr:MULTISPECIES: tetratricopeptide repeat protein [unclassified Moorena]NEO16535.1 tetratricopeptide repeat protein [Moorena sp. SIO3E8]NEQ03065.1 tetratricopeptide repeat protein [Moorena sp. SIO3F7]
MNNQLINSANPLGGRYKIISKLGAGGFGQTFLARDLHLPGTPQCVIKQLKPQVTDPQCLEIAKRLFEREAQVLYQLGNHDQIPQLLAHFEENQEFYLAQEFIDGEPLNQEIRQPWESNRVIALLQDILQVLVFVHEQRVIHRDIKPPNLIRRRKDNRIVMIDFGAVKQASTQIIDPETGQTKTIAIGSHGYTPKEQFGGNPRFSSDIYAVGMVGIQALTGIHPKFLKENSETGEINWRDRVQVNIQVNSELADILDCMVRYDFRDRYPTAVEALAAVQRLTAAPTIAMSATVPEETVSVSATSAQTQARSEIIRRWLTKPWLMITVLAGMGISISVIGTKTFLVTKPVSQTDNITDNISDTVAETSTTSSESKPGTPAVVSNTPESTTTSSVQKTIPESDTESAAKSPSDPETQPTETQPTAIELNSQGESLRQAGKYQQALMTYEKAIARDSNLAEAHWGRCYSLNSLGRTPEGLAACDQALALKPDYPEALWSKGAALESQNTPTAITQALTLYEQAIAIKPDFADAWINRGVALHKLKRYSEAIKAYERALQLNPNSADAWSNLGAAYWAKGQYKEAINAMENALQIQPNHPNAKNLRQQAREQLGR